MPSTSVRSRASLSRSAALALAQRRFGPTLLGDVAEHHDAARNSPRDIADRGCAEPARDPPPVGLDDLVQLVLDDLALQDGTGTRPLLGRDQAAVEMVAFVDLAVAACRRDVRRPAPELVEPRVAEQN